MKVIVTLTIDGTKETRLEGDCPFFGDGIGYKKGVDRQLRDIGFWLFDWRYAGHSGPPQKSRVFVPWTSALYIEELVP
ncbi:hypothetical protein ES703_111882 [subsurface metagenome]